ncbi:MAG TPA: hypothetical protein VFW50_30930 [Streptosporangiaceae bacterium]|nr:hypothetical protein [Streptosporangiaceae bacterium]
MSGAVVIGAYAYSIRVTAGVALRPSGPQARRIERSVTVATIVELVAAFVLPAVVTAAGRPGWVLPSTLSGPALAITTGIAAGVLLLGTALAGFRDLARIRAARQHLAA